MSSPAVRRRYDSLGIGAEIMGRDTCGPQTGSWTWTDFGSGVTQITLTRRG